jgi:hypothetical protein
VIQQIPSLEIGKSFPSIDMEGSLPDLTDRQLYTQSSEPAILLPKTPVDGKNNFDPIISSPFESEMDIDDADSSAESDQFYREYRGASAHFKKAFSLGIIDNRFETETQLMKSMEGLQLQDLENTIFDQQLCMSWHGYALDMMVRYWDYIFEKFDSSKNKLL